MTGFARIDTSLPQRSGLLRLLRRLESDDLSLDEMERIAGSIQQAGRHVLPPLMRRLRKATSGTVLARYVYVLGLFEEKNWLDEFVHITLMRTDLENEARTVLLTGLERFGVDIEDLPFSRLLKQEQTSSLSGLETLLAKGKSGYSSFMEDFVGFSPEIQISLVRRLANSKGANAVYLLEILLDYSDPEIVREALRSLGKIKRKSSAEVLFHYLRYGDEAFRYLAEKNLRKLSFQGIHPDTGMVGVSSALFQVTAVSPLEGTGFRSLWFSRRNEKGGFEVLFLQIHESCGITDVVGYDDLTRDDHDELFREAVVEEALMEVSSTYAHSLIKDALFLNMDRGFPVPFEFSVRRGMLGTGETTPEPYVPDFSGFDLDRIAESAHLLQDADTLLDEECFAGWFSAQGKVFDIVDTLTNPQDTGNSLVSEKNAGALLRQFMSDVVVPEKNRIARRLFLTADLMLKTGCERILVERSLCAALNIANQSVPYQKNPFLRRFALESLSFARDALAEGYDPRKHETEWDDGEKSD